MYLREYVLKKSKYEVIFKDNLLRFKAAPFRFRFERFRFHCEAARQ